MAQHSKRVPGRTPRTAHLKKGTRPSKKPANIKDVKRYLNVIFPKMAC